MDGFRLEGFEPLLHLLIGAHGQADFGVCGHGEGGELIGAYHLHGFAHLAQFGDNPGQGAHDAVDLGLPGVGGQ